MIDHASVQHHHSHTYEVAYIIVSQACIMAFRDHVRVPVF